MGHQQIYLAGSGTVAVWLDIAPQSPGVFEDATILGYDFSTNQPLTITDKPGIYRNLAISSSTVIWTEQVNRYGSAEILHAKSLKTREEYVLATAPGSTSPAVYDTTVVWLESINGTRSIVTTKFGSNEKVIIFKELTAEGWNIFVPTISSDIIAWQEVICSNNCRTYENSRLQVFDRKTNKLLNPITLTTVYYPYTAIGKNIFMISNVGSVISLVDSTTGSFTTLSRIAGSNTPAIVNNMVLWSRGGNYGQIWGFDIINPAKMLRLAPVKDSLEQFYPTIAGSYLLWQDYVKTSGHVIYAVPLTQALLPVFNDNSFSETWNKVDRAVEEVPNIGRGYTWGPPVLGSLDITSELYDGKLRQVQYFDKARMEVNPGGSGSYRVTTGLLVKELVSGFRQDGDKAFTKLTPSLVQVAGDPNTGGGNPFAPTYASFAKVATISGDENGQPPAQNSLITTRIDKAGVATNFTPPEARRYSGYDPVTKHNIADVFVTFGQQRGLIWDGSNFVEGSVFFDDPTYILGRPITEAYWLRAEIGGVERDVLVQLFERRMLTYTPSNPEGYKVEMGNVGQHYYQWRYNRNF